jgi:hypothetical protein
LLKKDNFSGEEYSSADHFEFILVHEGREYILTHSPDDMTFSTTTQYWEDGQRPRDQWNWGGTIDGAIDGLQRLADLRDTMQEVTDKSIVAVPREIRTPDW